jgi:thymidylate synthase (FAD)
MLLLNALTFQRVLQVSNRMEQEIREREATSGGNVDLIDSMGDDKAVVNAARVSFNRDMVEGKTEYEYKRSDEKLIKYLAEHGHWSPFSHCFATFKISAPVFIARQLMKHQVGLAWNETSRRYVDTFPRFWYPTTWRERAENLKQGSTNHEIYGKTWVDERYQNAITLCERTYKEMLKAGVCPEQARSVLPQSMITKWYWSGSLYAFARVCNLRLQEDAQTETRWIAEAIAKHMQDIFPMSWKYLVEGLAPKEEDDMSERMKEIYKGSWPGPGV